MSLFSQAEIIQLIRNGQPGESGKDHIPVAKLFLPGTGSIWLLSEIDKDEPTRAMGLFDNGRGLIKYGPLDLNIVKHLLNDGHPIMRDSYFVGKYPLSVYANVAFALRFITEVDAILEKNNPYKPPGPSPH